MDAIFAKKKRTGAVSLLSLQMVDIGGGPLAEVVTIRLGNVADELDAAKEFLFSANAITAKHDLC